MSRRHDDDTLRVLTLFDIKEALYILNRATICLVIFTAYHFILKAAACVISRVLVVYDDAQ